MPIHFGFLENGCKFDGDIIISLELAWRSIQEFSGIKGSKIEGAEGKAYSQLFLKAVKLKTLRVELPIIFSVVFVVSSHNDDR